MTEIHGSGKPAAKGNNIIKNDFEKWLDSKEGKDCMQPANFTTERSLDYLQNRLWWAFTAGQGSMISSSNTQPAQEQDEAKGKMLNELKQSVVEHLMDNPDVDSKFLHAGNKSYTRRGLAKEIQYETEEGVKALTNLISLTIDLMSRNKLPSSLQPSQERDEATDLLIDSLKVQIAEMEQRLSQPSQGEAVEFAEWVSINGWSFWKNFSGTNIQEKGPVWINENKGMGGQKLPTTIELRQLFLKHKQQQK